MSLKIPKHVGRTYVTNGYLLVTVQFGGLNTV